jgi:hypothetical protein
VGGRQNWRKGSQVGGRRNWRNAVRGLAGGTGEKAAKMLADRTV